jgi:thioredoxin reductase
MQKRRIVIVGDSPATYVCGIYLYTANIQPVIIRNSMGLDYRCTVIPGLDLTGEEYNQKCYEQAANMGLDIREGRSVSATKGDRFVVSYDGYTIEADILVTDESLGLPGSGDLYVIESLILEREAIVVAGAGCVAAFEIKDCLN